MAQSCFLHRVSFCCTAKWISDVCEAYCHFLLRGSSWPRDPASIACTAGRFFTTVSPGKPPVPIVWVNSFLLEVPESARKLFYLLLGEGAGKPVSKVTGQLFKQLLKVVWSYWAFIHHDGVITHLEPDILECEVRWALGSITTNKASGGDRIQLSYFKSWKMMLCKCCTQYVSKFGKLSSGHRTGKRSVFIPMPKNAQTTTQLHSAHTLVK